MPPGAGATGREDAQCSQGGDREAEQNPVVEGETAGREQQDEGRQALEGQG
ncbi:hypothetical protein ACPA9J_20500 [Pseudomonas aeruginosa]